MTVFTAAMPEFLTGVAIATSKHSTAHSNLSSDHGAGTAIQQMIPNKQQTPNKKQTPNTRLSQQAN